MPLRITVCPYRLRFKRPFGTAHGLRDGTDALFIRVEDEGSFGHGEITLPPYLKETVPSVRSRIASIARIGVWRAHELVALLDELEPVRDSAPTRAGLHMALADLIAKKNHCSLSEQLGVASGETPVALFTIGICSVEDALDQLRELPCTHALKLKASDQLAPKRISAVIESCNAIVLVDGNQGFQSVEDACKALEVIPKNRLIGVEQPFSTRNDSWNRELTEKSGAEVFADESVQGIHDLERLAGDFEGVNIKLMKCGGLDHALELASRAAQLNLRVMLGCMSESSLGCTAMAHLASVAQVMDLDGPWLLANDPWRGITFSSTGHYSMPTGAGIGVEPQIELTFIDP
ncbi:MAG: hypothetical protein IPM12_12050 [Flavobacteriales bacterium]|nr:hypothetical protein [Flavobacteriales bacterium]